MAAAEGTLERVGNDPVQITGSLLSLLPSVVLHGAVAALIWLGFSGAPEEVQPPVAFIALAPAAAPEPDPEPLPLPPTGMVLPQPEPPPAQPVLDFAPRALPELEGFPFDPAATREAPPEDAAPIEKAEEKPKPEKPKPAKAKPKPAAKPKPQREAQKAPPPAAAQPQPSEMASASAPAARPTAHAPAQPAGPTQNAAISDAPVRVTNPNYAGACPISYPERARRRDQEGTVVIHALIGTDGKPVEVTVAQSSGHRLLDEAARDAIAGCAFVPQKVGGRAVRAIVEIPIPFKLI